MSTRTEFVIGQQNLPGVSGKLEQINIVLTSISVPKTVLDPRSVTALYRLSGQALACLMRSLRSPAGCLYNDAISRKAEKADKIEFLSGEKASFLIFFNP